MFDPAYKDICLKLLEKGRTIEEVSLEMKVPKKSLKRWKQMGSERKKGCGRKIKDPEMENKLIEWFNERKAKGKEIYPRMMKAKALKLSKYDKSEFRASKGWLEKLKKKYNLVFTSKKAKSIVSMDMVNSENVVTNTHLNDEKEELGQLDLNYQEKEGNLSN